MKGKARLAMACRMAGCKENEASVARLCVAGAPGKKDDAPGHAEVWIAPLYDVLS